jgi:Tol biopolymer transport system component
MPLSPGDKLGPYEVVAPIGAGGMGEVYRARDPRMGREVAIKVSAERFNDRFEREVHAVAALNHPHICHLYDVGPHYLVMELVEGPTLAERVGAGAIPLEESLAIARQIAEALEAAHEKGIIHRDLKPANVKITPEGVVKVLDFGLAKLADPASTSQGAPDVSPTLTIQQATRVGVILGTAAYMSPEQASGKPVDKRADIWSFGVVLYELLTGERLFDGETVSHTLAAVLTKDPDWSQLPGSTPASVRRLLRRCLERDRKRRLPDIAVARLEIDEAFGGDAFGGAAPGIPKKSHWPERAAWIILAGTLLSVALFLAARTGRTPDSRALFRFAVYPPEKAAFAGSVVATVPVPQFALSPDGGAVVFAAAAAGAKPRLWVRAMEDVAARPLPGTENAQNPFWSPDSRWLGFFNEGRLLKVPAAGGLVQVMTQGLADSFGGSWGPDGTILIGSGTNPVSRVSSAGGTVTTVTKVDKSRQEHTHRWPQFLPDGRHLLYYSINADPEKRAIYVQELGSARRVLVMKSKYRAAWSPPGYLLFPGDNGGLYAQPMDPKTFLLSGEPALVADRVNVGATYRAAFSVGGGVLVYRGDDALRLGPLVWRDRNGKSLGEVGRPDGFTSLTISPDEKKVAVTIGPSSHSDNWVMDLGTGVLTRMTEDGGSAPLPGLWSPDSERLAINHSKGNLEITVASGKTRVLDGSGLIAQDWAPANRFVLAIKPRGTELATLPLDPAARPQDVNSEPGSRNFFRLSPNGRFVVYVSTIRNPGQIFVASYPSFDQKRQVSKDGGTYPTWRRDGKEIFFRSPDGFLMSVPIRTESKIEAEAPKPLFKYPAGPQGQTYWPAGDGKRFLVKDSDEHEKMPITVVVNWAAELKP